MEGGWTYSLMLMKRYSFGILMCFCILAVSLRAETPVWSWQQTEGGLALQNQGRTLWGLTWDRKGPKSYFHPLATVDGEVLTALSPEDHPWHRGLWFSWKYINGLNYWEENRKTGESEGLTELTGLKVVAGADFSAQVDLQFSYHPPGKPEVMAEKRRLVISAPDASGAYRIDWSAVFTAGSEPVKLDRTPPPQAGGPAHGGYAGLSVRLPAGIQGWSYRTSEGGKTVAEGHGKPARWVDLSNVRCGIAIFDHPDNPRHPQAWYLSDQPKLMYFSPALIFAEPMELKPGQSFALRYQVLVHSQTATVESLQSQWEAFSKSKNP